MPNNARKCDRERTKKWDPTPEEIAEACRQIRDEWSDWEYVKRSGSGRPEPFCVPHVTYTPHTPFESSEA